LISEFSPYIYADVFKVGYCRLKTWFHSQIDLGLEVVLVDLWLDDKISWPNLDKVCTWLRDVRCMIWLTSLSLFHLSKKFKISVEIIIVQSCSRITWFCD